MSLDNTRSDTRSAYDESNDQPTLTISDHLPSSYGLSVSDSLPHLICRCIYLLDWTTGLEYRTGLSSFPFKPGVRAEGGTCLVS